MLKEKREGKHVGVQACKEVCLGLGLNFSPDDDFDVGNLRGAPEYVKVG